MARRPARKRPARSAPRSSPGTWFLWLVVLGLAAFSGWLWFHSVRTEPGGDERMAEASEPVVPIPDAPAFTPAPSPTPSPPRETPAPPSSVGSGPGGEPTPGVGPANSAPTGTVSVLPPATSKEARTKLSVDRIVAIQQALARRGISCGSIDGVAGPQTVAALRVFQRAEGLEVSGEADEATLRRLEVGGEVYTNYVVTAEDLARLTPVPKTWVGKSSSSRLDYETALELVSEGSRAHPRLVRALNPDINWAAVKPGSVVKVPVAPQPAPRGKPAFLRISLSEKTLRAFDARTNLLVHFPCSIARRVEKRPVGQLRVVRIAPNPNYRFDPDIFPESEEARRIRRKLMIPPGPNNPVGTAWIGLDRPGYGIHGTPNPEEVGRTESHGCFRLSNWDAEVLVKLVWIGLPVYVEP